VPPLPVMIRAKDGTRILLLLHISNSMQGSTWHSSTRSLHQIRVRLEHHPQSFDLNTLSAQDPHQQLEATELPLSVDIQPVHNHLLLTVSNSNTHLISSHRHRSRPSPKEALRLMVDRRTILEAASHNIHLQLLDLPSRHLLCTRTLVEVGVERHHTGLKVRLGLLSNSRAISSQVILCRLLILDSQLPVALASRANRPRVQFIKASRAHRMPATRASPVADTRAELHHLLAIRLSSPRPLLLAITSQTSRAIPVESRFLETTNKDSRQDISNHPATFDLLGKAASSKVIRQIGVRIGVTSCQPVLLMQQLQTRPGCFLLLALSEVAMLLIASIMGGNVCSQCSV